MQMKFNRILLMLIFMATTSQATFAQHGWSFIYENNARFEKIVFRSPLIGWADRGFSVPNFEILKTTDGGETWEGVFWAHMFVDGHITFYDNFRAIVPIGHGVILTQDAFHTWETIFYDSAYINDVVYLDSTTLIGGGCIEYGDSVINQFYTSADGGHSWVRRFYENLDEHGYAIGYLRKSASGTVLTPYSGPSIKRGTNRGQTWQQINNLPIVAYNFSSPSIGVFFACGSCCTQLDYRYPAIAKSIDDGLHWTTVWRDTLLRDPLIEIEFADSLHGWALADSFGLTVQTTDGGVTWENYVIENVQGWLWSLSFVDSTLGWALYNDGLQSRIYRYGTPQAVEPHPMEVSPVRWEILSAYPNPFNSTTSIQYSVPLSGRVTVNLWDMNGREVTTLCDGQTSPGVHHIQWNAQAYASGIYFCQVLAGNQRSEMKKLLLIK
jgi:hypothetical protein